MPGPRLPRLIDLHVDWLLQYAQETTIFDPALYAGTETRLGQAEGYLGATSVAFLACYRRGEDWSRYADPWAALGELVTRYEAEFPGRLLLGPDDLDRRRDDRDGLTWGVVGVEGFDALVRTTADLDRLPGLFARGVRLFQPSYDASGLLAGSAVPGDDRGLTDLGRAFLQTLADRPQEADGPRAVLDLAHLNPRSASDVLSWFEAAPDRLDRVIPAYSHGFLSNAELQGPRGLTPDALKRLRALGGFVGLTPAFHEQADGFARAIDTAAAEPFAGRAGVEGIGIGTDFLGVDRNPQGLGSAPEVVAWVGSRFSPPMADALIFGNGEALLRRLVGADR